MSSGLCCTTSLPLFGAPVLMGNRLTNKATGCTSTQTPLLIDMDLHNRLLFVGPILWITLCVSVLEGESAAEGSPRLLHRCSWPSTHCPVCPPGFLQDDGYEYGEYEDPLPLNCSTTEAIKGGRVSYSQVKDAVLFLSSRALKPNSHT